METLSTSNPKARKDHKCSWCGQFIPKGEKYERGTCKFDGLIYTWKNHECCMKIAQKLDMWYDTDGEGVTDEDFYQSIHEEYRVIMDKHFNVAYGSKDFEFPQFKEQLILVLNHHNIPHTLAT